MGLLARIWNLGSLLLQLFIRPLYWLIRPLPRPLSEASLLRPLSEASLLQLLWPCTRCLPLSIFLKRSNSITASVAAPQVTPTRPFFRSLRGRRQLPNDYVYESELDNQSTIAHVVTSLSDLEILEECPVKPPPHA